MELLALTLFNSPFASCLKIMQNIFYSEFISKWVCECVRINNAPIKYVIGNTNFRYTNLHTHKLTYTQTTIYVTFRVFCSYN